VRPALRYDHDLIRDLLRDRFGIGDIPRVVLLNKTGGIDRKDLIIINGVKFGWLSFDPCSKEYQVDLIYDALPFILAGVSDGIVDIGDRPATTGENPGTGRIGGKKVPVKTGLSDGCVIVRMGSKLGIGQLAGGEVRIRQIGRITPVSVPDPDWDDVIDGNRYHLKNLERNAIRFIRQHMHDKPGINVSFSGGKDSTAVLELAVRAGVKDAYFVDTGMEFPETLAFVAGSGVQTRLKGGISGSGWKRKARLKRTTAGAANI
jgi:3''-phosphoadenosine 5''-phosphosulfate sulfotransferase (PAPS reductase)/FAD synthetase and related enzymes